MASLPYDAVNSIHKAMAWPLRALSRRNIGPFGGDNTISVVIEAVLAKKRGEDPDVSLSKTDQFFVKQLTGRAIPDVVMEYRELNHEAQLEILRLRSRSALTTIWLGAGAFTLRHPLLAQRRPADWHIWTDKDPKVFKQAFTVFEEMRKRKGIKDIPYEISLPGQVDRLNDWIKMAADQSDQILLNTYGLFYVFTLEENQDWLKRLVIPPNKKVWLIANSPGAKLPFMAGTMAAFHHQRMMHYQTEHIDALIQDAFPEAKLLWDRPRHSTRNKVWATWLYELT